ncbi:MAG: DUF5320 domain-containing protein [Bacteroidales bacterium]|nr:DUF5320 domain-containing protein [Bacteroidales bacterium]MCF8391874.1 DUF5320 domain-containing protein [Bacteroidales bacterium]
MPKLDGTGPEGEGSQSGRKLGKCSNSKDEEKIQKLGKGMGKRRNANGGIGRGKRLNSGKK